MTDERQGLLGLRGIMTAILFCDTETTGLALSDDIWEFAAIRREADGTETEHHLFIDHDERKCRALPDSFRADHERRWPRDAQVVSREMASELIHELTKDGPHIVGAVPNFDTERLALMLRSYGFEPSWHYHLIDVENLAVGYLAGLASHGHSEVTCGPRCGQGGAELPSLPWDSDAISAACGVVVPIEERHTAMGDARWARALYDAVCLPRTALTFPACTCPLVEIGSYSTGPDTYEPDEHCPLHGIGAPHSAFPPEPADCPPGCTLSCCVPTQGQSDEVAEMLSKPPVEGGAF